MSIEPEKKVDYLEVDESIPGQNYVCLSFISPEALIEERNAFKCVKFLQSYCATQKLKFDDVYSQYQDFTYKHDDKLQRDFDEKHDFQTSIRGLKVRGVFDSRSAADDRAKKLSTKDSGFHTFVGQVGYWLPWDPNADKVQDEVFQNSQLNEMMEKYQENNVSRDMFYEEQKREKVKEAKEDVIRAKKMAKEEAEAKEEQERLDQVPALVEGIEDLEPEPELQDDQADQNIGFSPTTSKSPVPESDGVSEVIRSGSEVSDEMKESLESDPWLSQKGGGN